MPYIYLASPYMDKDPNKMRKRYHDVMDWTAQYVRVYSAPTLYSPIVHFHEMAVKFKLPKDAGFWERHNQQMIINCSALWVLKLDGWRQSGGIFGSKEKKLLGEVPFAQQLKKEVRFVDP